MDSERVLRIRGGSLIMEIGSREFPLDAVLDVFSWKIGVFSGKFMLLGC